jgi:tripartite-type tricarboxylate transporter receptor subunit TctC
MACLAPALADAQSWPNRPIKAIVPFAAGGGTDLMGRLAAKHIGDRLGQQVYVENRAGANGSIGVQAVMQADPDGYTIGVISDTPITVNPSLYDNPNYQPLRDLTAVAMINRYPSFLVANPKVPVKNVADMIRLAKEKPGTMNYGSGGIGNFSHLGLELLALQTGIKLVHVPFRGVGPATAAALAGDVQLMYNNIATALPHVRAGKLTGIAIGDLKRLDALPDVPTIAETVPGFEMSPWIGIFVPAKTPNDIVVRLSRAVADFLKHPDVIKTFADQQIGASYRDTADFTKFAREETEKWTKVIKSLGIKVQ